MSTQDAITLIQTFNDLYKDHNGLFVSSWSGVRPAQPSLPKSRHLSALPEPDGRGHPKLQVEIRQRKDG